MPQNAGLPWTLAEEESLYDETGKGWRVSEIAAAHGRTTGAIRARQKRMGLRSETGELISPLPEFQSYSRTRKEPAARLRPKLTPTKRTANIAVEVKPLNSIRRQSQPIGWPEEFPLDSSCVEMLWYALRHDIEALPPKGRSRDMLERRSEVALARLSPGNEFHPLAKLSELGQRYSVTRERIRQIESKTLRRLKAGVQYGRNLTARVLDLIKEKALEEHAEAPLSWFTGELTRQRCSSAFIEFVLTSYLSRESVSQMEAHRLVSQAIAAIRKIRRKEVAVGRLDKALDAEPESVRKANAFVLRILKKAVWPGHLGHQRLNLAGLPVLRQCRYEQPYYSKTLQRLIGFDSMGERRLIRALDVCTVVTEFAEQPLEIRYQHDGADRIYIPDLLVRTDTNLFFVIEIKGRNRLADGVTLAKALAAQDYLGQRGIGYCLVDANGFGLDDLRALEPDKDFERQLDDLLRRNGVLRRSAFEKLFDPERRHWAYDQLQGAVLRRGLRYETSLIPLPDNPHRYCFDFRLRAR
ncbi:TnsA endonuclease N-terminal domain-containing protein [Phyllobacterium sp. YR531]|uniref:TnsA endonuclease N-terminal domain-containing protein n=1 Tax=Phyllobacterium sp. YR531 TaxID=1144343 RepID=UPI00026F5BA2|nr:TnsA endonuclease N-terminal domain-containing protein [Phyllobacterium sp. YR531]EJN02512.1 RNA polymerase sigma factor, sigma-70 family [Phyllobacterium sp. YR531]